MARACGADRIVVAAVVVPSCIATAEHPFLSLAFDLGYLGNPHLINNPWGKARWECMIRSLDHYVFASDVRAPVYVSVRTCDLVRRESPHPFQCYVIVSG